MQRCFAYLTTSLWSYNQSLNVWEPIMEPWQLLLHMDTNPNPYSSAGIAPGTSSVQLATLYAFSHAGTGVAGADLYSQAWVGTGLAAKLGGCMTSGCTAPFSFGLLC